MSITSKITKKTVAAATVIAAAAISLTACGSSSNNSAATTAPATPGVFTTPSGNEKGSQSNPVNIGVVGAGQSQWQVLKQAAQAKGIYIKYTDFTDYNQPNPALAQGQLDLNEFQHILFLSQYNVQSGQNLVPIGSTAIYPLALYSKKYTNVADIPAGSQIAIPNDQTNQARAIEVLAEAKLVNLQPNTNSLTAGPQNILSSSKVKVVPVAADQTSRSLGSIAGAVINNDYIAAAGLKPSQAIAQDDPKSDASKPFINIWVSQAKDASNPVYLEIVKLAQTKEYQDALQQNSGGTAVFVNDTPAELQAVLANVIKESKQK